MKYAFGILWKNFIIYIAFEFRTQYFIIKQQPRVPTRGCQKPPAMLVANNFSFKSIIYYIFRFEAIGNSEKNAILYNLYRLSLSFFLPALGNTGEK